MDVMVRFQGGAMGVGAEEPWKSQVSRMSQVKSISTRGQEGGQLFRGKSAGS